MPAEEDLTDEQLMARVVGGDDRAFQVLVRRHRGRVYHIALAISGDRGHAEDALQETFLAAHRAASGFRGESFRAWLYTIARHQASRTRRRSAPIPTDDETLEALGVAAGWGSVVAENGGERRDRLAHALSSLSDDDRAILVLRDLEERSGSETAAALGITLQAMKSRLHRARLRLAVILRGGNDDGS